MDKRNATGLTLGRAGLLLVSLLPATLVLAASCVGPAGDADADETEAPAETEAPVDTTQQAADGSADGCTDGSATSDSSSSATAWPACPDSLWVTCGIPKPEGVTLSYAPPQDDLCGITLPLTNNSTTCGYKITLYPYGSPCNGYDPCDVLAHEACHITQIKSLCAACKTAHPGGGLAFRDCVALSGIDCKPHMQAECLKVGCDRGAEWQCDQRWLECAMVKSNPNLVSKGGIACSSFANGAGSCACNTMHGSQCKYGICSSGTCGASGSGCGCSPPPPPPSDAGSDGSADAPSDG